MSATILAFPFGQATMERLHARHVIGTTAAAIRVANARQAVANLAHVKALLDEYDAEKLIGEPSQEIRQALREVYNGGYAHEW